MEPTPDVMPTPDHPSPSPSSGATRAPRPPSVFLTKIVPIVLLAAGVVAAYEWWSGMWDPELYGPPVGTISSKRTGSDSGPPKTGKKKAGRRKGAQPNAGKLEQAPADKTEKPDEPKSDQPPEGKTEKPADETPKADPAKK